MNLTENDYKNIAEQISEGKNNIEYEKDGEVLLIDCEYKVQGYVEDDYYRGTGAFVKTARQLTIENTFCCSEDGREKPCIVNETLLEQLVA